MPNGYVIVTEEITDPVRFEAYGEKALPTILQYNGRVVVVDDDSEVLEGQWHGSRTVILEFDSVESARTWYHSAEYQAAIGDRHASAESNLVIVRGLEAPVG